MFRWVGIALFFLVGLSVEVDASPARDWKIGGHVGLVWRHYMQSPDGNQEGDAAALRFLPEWTLRQGPLRLTVAPDLRLENAGSGRGRADFNELYLSTRYGETTLEFGITRLFWSVTESRHLQNIINPPDLAAHYAGDTTLGIALLRLAQPTGFGQIELILVPWDRDPRYPGERGRPHTALPILGDVIHPEGRPAAWATRMALNGGEFDAHLSYFSGLDREAVFTPQFDITGLPVGLRASRHPIRQWGVDLQAPLGNLLVKGEAIHRTGYARGFSSAVLGGEYTLNGVADSARDLTFMLEYQFDDRSEDAPLPSMKQGIYGGIRMTFNDPASSEFKIGLLHERPGKAKVWRGDFSRRIGNDWTIEGALNLFSDVHAQPALSGFARDSYLEVQLKRNFHLSLFP